MNARHYITGIDVEDARHWYISLNELDDPPAGFSLIPERDRIDVASEDEAAAIKNKE